jgi:signal peptidase
VLEDHVSAAQAARLAPGDIVTFHVAGSTTELITHKIVAIRPQGSSTPHGVADSSSIRYQTKGVANNAPDATLVAPNQVVGVYHFNIPFGGYFLQAIQHKVVFFFVMFVPLLFLISSEIAKRWHEPEPVRSRELPKGRSHRKPRQPSGQPAVSVEATLTSASDADVDTRGGGSELSRR